MADTVTPQTPPRKLFRPSNKTPPVRRFRPTTPTLTDYALSDTTGDTPIGLIDNDLLTPTDTVSRSTDRAESPLLKSPGTPKAKPSPSKNIFARAQDRARRRASKTLEESTGELLEQASNASDVIESPSDLAQYFRDRGHQGLSDFVSALLGNSYDEGDKSQSQEGDKTPVGALAAISPDPLEELPTDDNLVIEPNDRTKQAVAQSAGDKTDTPSDIKDPVEGTGSIDSLRNSQSAEKGKMGDTDKTPKPAEVSKKAEWATEGNKNSVVGAEPVNKIGEPDTSKISDTAHVDDPKVEGKKTTDQANGAVSGAKQNVGGNTPKPSKDGSRVADTKGKPVHIQRNIEIPLPRPERVVHSPPLPEKPEMGNIAAGLGDVKDLPTTDHLCSTDDLPEIPDDAPGDPPEEMLDPSVHSRSANISPIPPIPRIAPLGLSSPPNLFRLAHGMGGNTVDDVGNIVDKSGKVLGHATGDLPAMIGKTVADNGEVYDDDGEVVGFVSENFTGPPPPSEIPQEVLGGLKVDHQGNIIDANGNHIGRFNQKEGEGKVAPFMKSRQADGVDEEESKPKEAEKPKTNRGSPSELFLDVKSTNDGIQLTIRIPTMFSKEAREAKEKEKEQKEKEKESTEH
ncbi:hypothetical protein F4778DRAFT_773143 [Xylariomycetidae sp. FL2044]|nr:hypothetical protein F4778DRAFT_773143 [Xylariomycetidae sp. FL2044]